MSRFVVVANRTGGQGKTLVSLLLIRSFRAVLGTKDVGAMCADSGAQNGGDGISKLGRMVPGVIEVGSGPSAETMMNDASEALGYWDVIAESLISDDAPKVFILDVGANIVDRVLEWGRASEFDDSIGGEVESELVVPVVARTKSLADALGVFQSAVMPGGINFKKIYLVLNEWLGAFSEVERLPEWIELMRFAKKHGVQTVVIPKCASRLLPMAEEEHISLQDLSALTPVDIAQKMGWMRMKASREATSFNSWLESVDEALRKGGVLDLGDQEGAGFVDAKNVSDQVPK